MAESHSEREERILSFWEKDKTFQKSIDKSSPKGDFTFYDGPPFATGTPHYGHILAGTIKDVIPRYKTMQGYSVRRRWGWDCHGLPVENLIEKELGLKSKKDIIDYGLEKFNAAARGSVMRYADEWRRIVPRLGRWVDMDNDYRTLDATYTESVWWAFKQLHEKGLVYEDFKSMYYCPRCETTLSNFEVAQGYRDITDISVYVKFEIADEPGTFLIAWTTTPWTLPGNVALAVGADIEYLKIQEVEHVGDENFNPVTNNKGVYFVAKEVFEKKATPFPKGNFVFMGRTFHVAGSMKGSELVGKSYKPIFKYYFDDADLKDGENGWKIYSAGFVTTTDGTGIVHIAPAFGADDYELLKKYKLPFVQHVAHDGVFKPEVKDFAGMKVKPKDTDEDKNAHQAADIEVIKWLAHNGFLFEKEKIIHSYPHCWRCETPLLNYATSSWFVKVSSFKDKLVKENNKIGWVPESVGVGRFGNWLEGARDWAVSRSRFWGAPIPVWKEEGTGKCHFIGSVADIKRHSHAKNTYYMIRHGQAENNAANIVMTDDVKSPCHLTETGKEQVKKATVGLKGIKFDLVFVSPFMRTQETAAILKSELGWSDDMLHTDIRIQELQAGAWNGKPLDQFKASFHTEDRFERRPEGGENYADIKKRMGDFLYEQESKYSGKTILVITHETSGFLLHAAALGLDREEAKRVQGERVDFIDNAEVRKLDFFPLPHNAEYELDLHRPFIDEIELRTDAGTKLVRVPDVFDCWFESGSMSYAEAHYPFKNGKGTEEGKVFDPKGGLFRKSRGYPADFIAEGVDQTRGWFYSMLVLGTALFDKAPYKNVIVNGLVLAEDGTKMSKSKHNFPDPMIVVDKYGADALRHYLVSSQVIRGEDLRFSEKGVDEVVKKVINRLLNVVTFYEMYAGELNSSVNANSTDKLDQWIISRLNESIMAITSGFESYELDRAARPIEGLVDDLSTWYLRRSRDRFKGSDDTAKQSALATTHFVLIEIAKIIAPFMPFLAEDIYNRVNKGSYSSIHLQSWPTASKINKEVLQSMQKTRSIASKGLEARMKAGVNVRQPLSKLSVNKLITTDLASEYLEVIKDEVNVKEVALGVIIDTDVALDTAMTPELKEEGDLRELIRKIQDMRKEKNLSVNDKAVLMATDDLKPLITKNESKIRSTTNLTSIEYGTALGLK